MTPDEIIKLAMSAGVAPMMTNKPVMYPSQEALETFAALVAAHEREACAEMVWPTQQIKVWSDKEINAMTGAFNRAQEKHGWYETLMAVGAAALKNRAAAIRARGEAEYKRGEQ
jgi:hypothetical protein